MRINFFACQLLLFVSIFFCTTTHAFESHHCTEVWHNYAIGKEPPKNLTRSHACKNHEAAESSTFGGYQVIDHKAYWKSSKKERHGNCSGIGPGALGQLLMPECYLPSQLQRHSVDEYREYWLVSEDGDHFKAATTQKSQLTAWQQNEKNRYAVDSHSVYLNSNEIVGADPNTFEVLFPFGDDQKWDLYYLAKDANHLYADGQLLPDIELSNIQWLDLPCQAVDKQCDTLTSQRVNIGQVGSDVIYLRYAHRATVFRGLAKPDLMCFQQGYQHYCKSGNQYFVIQPDYDEEAKLKVISDPIQGVSN